jgi:hypothetical protein
MHYKMLMVAKNRIRRGETEKTGEREKDSVIILIVDIT